MAKLASLPRKRKRRRLKQPPLITAEIKGPHSFPVIPAQKREARLDLHKREARLDSYAGTQGLHSTPLIPAQKREARLASSAGIQGLQIHEPAALDSHTCGNERDHFTYPQLRAALIEDLRATGVDVARVPREALEDYIESHQPARDFPELRPRGHRSKRARDHARMYEK